MTGWKGQTCAFCAMPPPPRRRLGKTGELVARCAGRWNVRNIPFLLLKNYRNSRKQAAWPGTGGTFWEEGETKDLASLSCALQPSICLLLLSLLPCLPSLPTPHASKRTSGRDKSSLVVVVGLTTCLSSQLHSFKWKSCCMRMASNTALRPLLLLSFIDICLSLCFFFLFHLLFFI